MAMYRATPMFYGGLLVLLVAVAGNGSSAQRIQTAGCSKLRQQHDTVDSDLSFMGSIQLDSIQFTFHHVDSVFHEFRGVVGDTLTLVQQAQNNLYRTVLTNAGLSRMYPLRNHTRRHVSPTVRSSDRVLHELRWIYTRLELFVLVAQRLNLNQPSSDLVRNIAILSDRIDSILNIFNIHYDSIQEEVVCQEAMPLTTDSYTRRELFISLVLRDAENALTRIQNVLSTCQVRRRAQGWRLGCSQHQSLFYDALPFGEQDVVMYQLEDFVE